MLVAVSAEASSADLDIEFSDAAIVLSARWGVCFRCRVTAGFGENANMCSGFEREAQSANGITGLAAPDCPAGLVKRRRRMSGREYATRGGAVARPSIDRTGLTKRRSKNDDQRERAKIKKRRSKCANQYTECQNQGAERTTGKHSFPVQVH
jgi:hypothetical protein